MAQSVTGSIAIIIACIAGTLFALAVLRHYWAPSTRRAHNDVVGPNVSVIGTTYAVLIAFMLSGVWSNLQLARVNTEQEANSLLNIFRFAYPLPPESGTQLQQLARDYSSVMITEEWPAMKHGGSSATARGITQQPWHTLAGVQPRNITEQMVMDHALSELSSMTEHRRIRLLESRERLPALLWAVLVVGGIVTVGSTCLFGVDNFKLHMVQVFEISFLLSLMLVAIASIDSSLPGGRARASGCVPLCPRDFRPAISDNWPRRTSGQPNHGAQAVTDYFRLRERVASKVNSEPAVKVISLVQG